MGNIHFTFDTTSFLDSDEILNESINRIHGYELAMWIHRELTTLGYDATDATDEDFGWYFHVEHDGNTYFCTTSIATDDQPSDEAHVTISKDRSLMDRILRRNKLLANDVVVTAIAEILTENAAIKNLARHFE